MPVERAQNCTHLDRSRYIRSVKIIQVDRVNSKPTQGFFQCLLNICRASVDHPVGLKYESKLGGQEDIIAFARAFKPGNGIGRNIARTNESNSPLADEVLAIPIDVCSVPESASAGIDSIEKLVEGRRIQNSYNRDITTVYTLRRASSG